MKKFLLSFAAVAAFSAQAAQPSAQEVSQLLKQLVMADVIQSRQDLIDWQVGDYHKMSIKLAFGSGTGDKFASKEDTAMKAVWLESNISILGQMQKSEALISRVDGKLLKLLVNGKEQDISEEQQIEILEQAETRITVTAGTFDCIYIRANITAQGQTQEVKMWANPIDVNLDGSLKTVMNSQIGEVTMELTEFGHR